MVVDPLVNVNTAPSPTVLIPVIVLSTKIVETPIPATLVPTGTVEFPPATVITSLTAMPVVTIPVMEESKAASITPAVVATPTVVETVTLVGAVSESSPPC